jgi:hypothetical protein
MVLDRARNGEAKRGNAMTISRMSIWAGSAAVAMTLALGMGIGELAQVDAGAAGLPMVQLDRVEVLAPRMPASAADLAASPLRGERTL